MNRRTLRLVVVVFAALAGMFGTAHAASATPSLTVSPDTFPSGQHVTITGTGFTPNTDVTVWFDSNGDGASGLVEPFGAHEPSDLVHTDSSGAFSDPMTVISNPGAHTVRAGTPPDGTPHFAEADVTIGKCLFQECTINGSLIVCILGYSPSDLIHDCKTLDSSYTNPTGVYNFKDVGPRFAGAGVLAAAVNDLNPLFLPGPGCAAMIAAIARAQGAPFGNSVPGQFDLFQPTRGLTNIACGPPFGPVPPIGYELGLYIAQATIQSNLDGNPQPDPAIADAQLIAAVVAAVQASAAVADLAAQAAGIPAGVTYTTIILAAQHAFATAAVGGALACGFVNYYCGGSDITANIMHQNIQQMLLVPVPFLDTRWGDIIGWSLPTCHSNVLPAKDPITGEYAKGICEQPGHETERTIPGSAGPDNIAGFPRCATGTVVGRSIGYDGDISFDVQDGTPYPAGTIDPTTGAAYPPGTIDPSSGPTVAPLTNYHNYESGEGGSPAPGGIDVEVPLTDRGRFPLALVLGGTRVTVCGHWVADMAESWNEIHPITSLTILAGPVVDTTPPVITPHVSGTLGNNDWYTSDVAVSWTVTDPETAVSASPGCDDISITTDSTGRTLTCTATSGGGTSEQSVTVKRDTTAPVIGHGVSPPVDGLNGWYVTAPTVTFTCSDTGSGVASCVANGDSSGSVTLGESATPQTVAGIATDNAGNVSNDSASVSVDLSDPTIVAATDRSANADGWFKAPVAVSFTCADAISGIATCPSPVTLGEGGDQSASGTATDHAGRTASASATHINVDMTAPVVTYSGNTTPYTVDQTVNITCAATDALSGIDTSTCANITGPAWSFGLGTTTRSASATDRAGNTGSASTTFTVIVTEASLDNLIRQFFGNDHGGANGLSAKVHSIVTAPNANAKRGKLGAFGNQVDAKTGNPLPPAQAALLKQLAAAL